MNPEFSAALRSFWAGRDWQTQRQVDSGHVDAGRRGAVTGGQHLGALQSVIANLFRDTGIPELTVGFKGPISVPGYYRRSKDWDIVVTAGKVLVAAIELKSQVGPSFGNNFNNRTEEAIGNAVDIWRAYEAGLFGQVRPWVAFVMVLERDYKSTTPLHDRAQTVFPADPVFQGTSYADRYQILLKRLVRERLYDAAAFVMTDRHSPEGEEPDEELSFSHLQAAIAGRVAYIAALAADE